MCRCEYSISIRIWLPTRGVGCYPHMPVQNVEGRGVYLIMLHLVTTSPRAAYSRTAVRRTVGNLNIIVR